MLRMATREKDILDLPTLNVDNLKIQLALKLNYTITRLIMQ